MGLENAAFVPMFTAVESEDPAWLFDDDRETLQQVQDKQESLRCEPATESPVAVDNANQSNKISSRISDPRIFASLHFFLGLIVCWCLCSDTVTENLDVHCRV